MRTLPASLSESLASGCTTLCRCWSVTRTDGLILGFTDHDRSLSFDGITFEASSGFNSGAIESATGLSVDTHTVTCALSSTSITDEDVERGSYDGAEVVLWLVDWRDTTSRLLLNRGHIGEIRRGELAFEAEIVSLSEQLNQPYGRAFIHGCDRRLGDAKCGVDLSSALYRGVAVVAAVIEPQRFAVSGLEAFSRGWFDGGHLEWTAGANAGVIGHVKTHLDPTGGGTVELWLTPPMAVQPGDGFTVTAGCNKTLVVRTKRKSPSSRIANALVWRDFSETSRDS